MPLLMRELKSEIYLLYLRIRYGINPDINRNLEVIPNDIV